MHKVKKDRVHFALKSFAEKAKKQRLAKGLSREDLADMIGLSKVAILKIENQDSLPTFETALKLALALNMSLGSFKRLAS